MRTRSLNEEDYLATMTPKMNDVTDRKLDPIDIWAYVDAVPPSDLQGHAIWDRFIEFVYRTDDNRFDHVLVMTKTKNVYLAVIVDIRRRAVHGHHLLNLIKLYGR